MPGIWTNEISWRLRDNVGTQCAGHKVTDLKVTA